MQQLFAFFITSIPLQARVYGISYAVKSYKYLKSDILVLTSDSRPLKGDMTFLPMLLCFNKVLMNKGKIIGQAVVTIFKIKTVAQL
ncbi:MAG: hypothetical protein GX206_12480 [Clostridiales bacterium]|nr:hypothetical protein [Clostridiales bacterium]